MSGKAEKKPESTFARMFNEKLAGKDKLIDMDVGRSFEQVTTEKMDEKIETETLKGHYGIED